jgi:RNA polymerase sigma-70 factor (ECF subfamily)
MEISRDEHQQRFAQYFAELQPALRVSLRMVVPDSEASAEILQNVAVVMWEKYPEVSDKVSFRKIAYTVMRYEILSYRRDKARNRVICDESVIELLVDESSISPPQMTREQELLEKHIARLSAEQKKLLLDAYQPDVQINLLAKEQGKTPMALYKKLQKIRSKLLKGIQEELKRDETRKKND